MNAITDIGSMSEYNALIKPFYLANVSDKSSFMAEHILVSVVGSAASSTFVKKAYTIVEACNDNIVQWTDNGTAFVVHDPDYFAAQVLPLFFKHSKFASFVRQLNSHGFHKLRAAVSLTTASVSSNTLLSPSQTYQDPTNDVKRFYTVSSDRSAVGDTSHASKAFHHEQCEVDDNNNNDRLWETMSFSTAGSFAAAPNNLLNKACKFSHPSFRQGRLDLLKHVNKGNGKDNAADTIGSYDVDSSEGRYEPKPMSKATISSELKRLRREIDGMQSQLYDLESEKQRLKSVLDTAPATTNAEVGQYPYNNSTAF